MKVFERFRRFRVSASYLNDFLSNGASDLLRLPRIFLIVVKPWFIKVICLFLH
ncbi:hypothetical protein HanIR_Chr07g0303261 [Helianthus annuus]|nr:hypothetical protein HanIR_Chr07g0303261 [Helianthus annuus]